ncbi:MAG: DNA-binding response regulator [Proteobacteria bacterium]|nr:MAG: DNA-binding response regulator [Pseudomonadota bacterium]
MKRILLIDDDERLGPLLASYFQRFELELVFVLDPGEGLRRLQRQDVDLVILDVMLPGFDGFETCRRIRRNCDIPIVMLTARGEITDRVVGLELGADDYLPKPFEPRELVARIQNILRRVSRTPDAPGLLDFGDLVVDTRKKQVTVLGKVVSLTSREYELLTLLAKQPNRKFSRDEIIGELRGTDVEIFSRAVDITVSRLRHKLRPADPIRTAWGIGYEFVY